MRIKQFAELTNLPPKTIRYYEEIGLLPPPNRLDNGYRDYGETDVDRARFIAGARSLDFSLADIEEILALREQREAPCRVVLDLLQERADEISRRISELQRMEAELRDLRAAVWESKASHLDAKTCMLKFTAVYEPHHHTLNSAVQTLPARNKNGRLLDGRSHDSTPTSAIVVL